jgi:signal peptidase II
VQERGPGPALTPAEPAARRRRLALLAGVAVAVVAVDQLTKRWALHALADGPIHLVWTLRLQLAFNTGVAFSLGRGGGAVVPLIALVVVVITVWSVRTLSSTAGAVAVGLLLGGAIGNLLDRAFRHGDGFFGGAVVDFIDLQWWPVFNVADACVVIGGLLLVLVTAKHDTG